MLVTATKVGDKGYVWSAEGAVWLRHSCRVVGAMTGNAAGRSQLTTGKGLPCELSPEELNLAVRQGWVVLQPEEAGLPQDCPSRSLTDSASVKRANACSTSDGDEQPAWLVAINAKRPVAVPVATSVLSDALGSNSLDRNTASAQASPSSVHCTTQVLDKRQQHRLHVYSDLHSKGYYITDGAKFGADYLLYPGDPLLFHAQFTVRIMSSGQVLKPALLAGSARGSHAARKHLLLAWVKEDCVQYMTVAPEGGFGATG